MNNAIVMKRPVKITSLYGSGIKKKGKIFHARYLFFFLNFFSERASPQLLRGIKALTSPAALSPDVFYAITE